MNSIIYLTLFLFLIFIILLVLFLIKKKSTTKDITPVVQNYQFVNGPKDKLLGVWCSTNEWLEIVDKVTFIFLYIALPNEIKLDDYESPFLHLSKNPKEDFKNHYSNMILCIGGFLATKKGWKEFSRHSISEWTMFFKNLKNMYGIHGINWVFIDQEDVLDSQLFLYIEQLNISLQNHIGFRIFLSLSTVIKNNLETFDNIILVSTEVDLTKIPLQKLLFSIPISERIENNKSAYSNFHKKLESLEKIQNNKYHLPIGMVLWCYGGHLGYSSMHKEIAKKFINKYISL